MTTRPEYAKLALIAGAANEWELPVPLDAGDRPPFQVDALPLYLRRYVGALADFTQTAPDLAATFVLGSFAGALARKVEVEIRAGYTEPVNLYLLPVALPGERKTAICREVAAPWDAFEAAETAKRSLDVAKAESERRMVEKERDRYEAEAARAKDGNERERARTLALKRAQELAELPPVVMPSYRTEDATPERLKTLLAEQGGRMCVLSAEGELFKIAQGRYSNGAASFDCLLKGHAGDTLFVDRIGRPRVVVDRPALTLALLVQPHVVGALFQHPEFRHRGLVARFLYAWPRSPLGARGVGRPMPDEVRAAYASAVDRCLCWKMPAAPSIVRLDEDAAALGLAFDRELEPQLGETGALVLLRDFAGKLPGAVYRLMAVLHLAERVTQAGAFDGEIPPIPRHVAEGAVALGRYFLAHARLAYGYGGADPVATGARRLLDWIRSRGAPAFVEREGFNALRAAFPEMADLRASLDLLADYHHIRKAEAPARNGPGRSPSPSWDVNPATLAPAPEPAVPDPEGVAS